jgi:hypothetical protein
MLSANAHHPAIVDGSYLIISRVQHEAMCNLPLDLRYLHMMFGQILIEFNIREHLMLQFVDLALAIISQEEQIE